MMNLIKTKTEKGFTLIELMIVVAIIGILAAIAIPQFAEYRIKAFNSAANADLRNIMTAQEAAYADTQAYVAFANSGSDTAATNSINSLPGAKLSKGVKATSGSVTATDYIANTKHLQGKKTYTGQASTGISDVASTAGTALF